METRTGYYSGNWVGSEADVGRWQLQQINENPVIAILPSADNEYYYKNTNIKKYEQDKMAQV